MQHPIFVDMYPSIALPTLFTVGRKEGNGVSRFITCIIALGCATDSPYVIGEIVGNVRKESPAPYIHGEKGLYFSPGKVPRHPPCVFDR